MEKAKERLQTAVQANRRGISPQTRLAWAVTAEEKGDWYNAWIQWSTIGDVSVDPGEAREARSRARIAYRKSLRGQKRRKGRDRERKAVERPLQATGDPVVLRSQLARVLRDALLVELGPDPESLRVGNQTTGG